MTQFLSNLWASAVKFFTPQQRTPDYADNVAQLFPEWHAVKASSFADPADVRAFKKCKATGKSDQECFKVGDNGIGFTGLQCWREDVAYVALPPEDWKARWGPKKANAAGRLVLLKYQGSVVETRLGDTMPAKKNIKNGAGIDLNPGAAKLLGIEPPFMVRLEWSWGE